LFIGFRLQVPHLIGQETKENPVKQLVAIILILSFSVAQNAIAADGKGAFFSKADIDNSVSLDRSEFKTFIKLLAKAGHKNANLVKKLHLYSIAWDRVNTDQNNVITPDEIKQAKWSGNRQAAAAKLY